MNFGWMVFRNFLVFGDTEQRLWLNSRGIVLVVGENHDDETSHNNGAGKTALVPDAPSWCLYGFTTRGYKDDQVIHRHGPQKNCMVAMEVWPGDDDEEERYVVVRARKHKVYGSRLHLFHVPIDCAWDAEDREALRPGGPLDCSGSSKEETQAKIDRLLGMSRETWRHTVVFGKSEAYRFSLLTDGQQKKVFDDLIGVERYAAAGKAARDASVDATIVEARATISQLERTLQASRSRLSTSKAAHAQFATEQQQRIARARQLWSEAKDELGKLHALAASEQERREARRQAAQASQEGAAAYDAATAKLATARATRAATERQLASQEAELARLEKQRTGRCRQCGQNVSQATIDKLVAEQLATVKAGRRQAHQEALQEHAANVEAKRLRQTVEPLYRGLERATAAVAEARQAAIDAGKLASRVKMLALDLTSAKSMVSPHLKAAEQERRDIAATKRELAIRRSDLQLAERRQLALRYWSDAFGQHGIRSDLIASTLPYLNAQAQRIATTLTAGNIAVEFRTSREKSKGGETDDFHVAVDNAHGAGDYQGNSEGERSKIDVVVGLSIQKLAATRATAKVPLAFFDEPFDAMDDTAADRVATFLTEELQERGSIFVITHKAALRSFFPRHIMVVKRGNSSTVED